MFTLKFEDNEQGRKRYEICTQAVILSNPQNGGRAVQTSEWDEVIGLLRSLKAGGIKSKQTIGGKALYDLKEGGSEIKLERAEHKLLLEFVRQPMWIPDGLEDVKDVLTWLEAIEHHKESPKHRREKLEGQVAGNIEPEPQDVEVLAGHDAIAALEAQIVRLKAEISNA